VRTWIAVVGVLLAVSACGSDDDAGSDTTETTTTLSKWRYADDEPGTLRANQPLTDADQIAAAAAAKELEAFVATCVENVPKLAFTGNEQAVQIWNDAGQNDDQLREKCADIGRNDPAARESVVKAADALTAELADAASSTTTTTTIDPNKAYISLKCPPEETEAVGSFRAEFDVEQSAPENVSIREWGIDYGDGRSYKAGSQRSAEEELYWHNYYETGAFEVTVWIVDAANERTEATCTFRWSN
jgi:hypothetical protein